LALSRGYGDGVPAGGAGTASRSGAGDIEYQPGHSVHCGLIPANFTTLAHFSDSAAT
jgi:hypothetical protein